MSASPRFRFRPPPIVPPPDLGWVLSAALAHRRPEFDPVDPLRALDLAERLGLLPRLAVRWPPAAIDRLGDEVARRLREARALAAARELRFDATLATVAEAARAIGTEIAPLKGRALVLAGDCLPGERPANDLDLLAPAQALEPLHKELRRRGLAVHPTSPAEHHLPPLRHPRGELVELHRYVPGVRLAGGASAGWHDLEAAGLFELPADPVLWAGVRLPSRTVRTAHALVHALAQHGSTARLAGWLLIGDLIDLRAEELAAKTWRDWLARDLAPAEIDAALALVDAVGDGRDPIAVPPNADAAELARHFTACALDVEYAEAVKGRAWAQPLSERSPGGARLQWVANALRPPAPTRPLSAPARAARWLTRPFELLLKAARASAAAVRIRSRHEPP